MYNIYISIVSLSLSLYVYIYIYTYSSVYGGEPLAGSIISSVIASLMERRWRVISSLYSGTTRPLFIASRSDYQLSTTCIISSLS